MKPKTRTIRQTVTFKATPHDVYAALTNGKLHSAFTDSVATIKPAIGASFTAYDGYISGKNLHLKEDKKIVWAWRAAESGWPEEHFSKITMSLKPIPNGTELTFVQTGVPKEHVGAIDEGWSEYYWGPLARMLRR
ncbi:MAG: SRPBCC domain-containing protein [Candidatus Kerfeldbacteria bacterium]|nr:SRPBCC domain-containing protein [Candidatus Kerfeldbacteria bacterium]